MPDSCSQSDTAAVEPSRARGLHWARPVIVIFVTAVLLAWTWPNCPELVTDFGREAYVPWRISDGEVLYRDLNYFNGPLSPYFNALAFDVLGVSLRTMKIVNATIAILVALLVYWMIRRIGDCLGAVVAGITFAGLFAAAHLSGAGNFNWLTPYSHDATHGIALSLAMLACLWQAQARRSWRWIALAGFLFGLVLLTKVEVGVAAVLGAGCAIVMMLLSPRDEAHDLSRGRIIPSFVLPALVPPIVAVLLLARAMPLADAARGAAGAWLWIGDDRISNLPFFLWVMGLDEPEANLLRLLGWLGAHALLLGVAVGAARLVKPCSRGAVIAAVVAALIIVIGMELTWERVKWSGMLRPLPVVLLVILAHGAMRWFSGREAIDRLLPRISLTVFALGFLLKIILNARAFHYGFALAMPGTMILVALLVSWAPAWVKRRDGSPWVARAIVLAMIVMLLRAHLAASQRWMALRNVPIGAGADQFNTDARGHYVAEVMREIERQRRPGDTLVALPEGAMINFLLRMPSTSRYQNFLPSEMMIYTEADMLRGLQQRPPTFVVVLHRVAREYESGPQERGMAIGEDKGRFGMDYGQQLVKWVLDEYRPILLAGAMPYTSPDFGVLLLRHEAEDHGTTMPATEPSTD